MRLEPPRWLAVFGAGLASALAFAPFHLFFLPLLTFPLFLHLIRNARGWRAFGLGWLFGFGFFLGGLHWVSAALFVDIAQFWWVLPIAAGALPMGLALFVGAAVWFTQSFASGPARPFVFAALWCAAEYARGHLLSGFPWQLLGYAWTGTPMVQLAAYGGAYGLSLWAALLAALPVLWFEGRRRLMAISLTVLLALGGLAGLARHEAATVKSIGLTLRLVQPNIGQTLKMDPTARSQNFQRLLATSLVPGQPLPDVLIWPETAMPYDVTAPDVQAALAEALPRLMKPDGLFLTGAVRRWDEGGETRYANSLLALDAQARLLISYDKTHLVPFGEFVPLRSLIPFASVAGGVDFTPGKGAETLHVLNTPAFSPLICYEVIFPRAVVKQADRPAWLVSITNDGWYGKTAGPYQHFDIARVRAIEEGLPMIRVANTGITGVIDGQGRVLQATRLGEAIALDVRLPKPLPPTWYARVGDVPFFFAALLLAGLALIRKRPYH